MSTPTLFSRFRLIFSSNLSTQEKLLLLDLCVYIGNNDTGWPTVETLARDCSQSRRRVTAHLQSLTDKGIVSSQRRRNQSALRSIHWEKLVNQDRTQAAHLDNQDETQATPRTRHPRPPECAADFSSGCATDGAQKDHGNNNRKKNGNNRGRAPFSPPSVDQVRAFCDASGMNIDPEAFVNFYQSKGWMVGNSKMQDWRASVRAWQMREPSFRAASRRGLEKLDSVDRAFAALLERVQMQSGE